MGLSNKRKYSLTDEYFGPRLLIKIIKFRGFFARDVLNMSVGLKIDFYPPLESPHTFTFERKQALADRLTEES